MKSHHGILTGKWEHLSTWLLYLWQTIGRDDGGSDEQRSGTSGLLVVWHTCAVVGGVYVFYIAEYSLLWLTGGHHYSHGNYEVGPFSQQSQLSRLLCTQFFVKATRKLDLYSLSECRPIARIFEGGRGVLLATPTLKSTSCILNLPQKFLWIIILLTDAIMTRMIAMLAFVYVKRINGA